MEVYILDSLLRREQVVDRFESLIWTERFSSAGEFELILQSTNEFRRDFTKGTKLAINNSYRVMTVETVEDSKTDDGKSVLRVRGPSLEAILQDRVAKNTLSNLTTEPKWNITNTPGAIARKIFNDICVLGHLSSDDIIPFMATGNLFPADTISEPATPVTVHLDPQSVYDAIKGICDLYDLGFRLTRNFDNSELFFNIYAGRDRTSNQITDTPMLFAESLDNVQNTSELTSIEKSKNVAYVFSPDGYAVVYPSWVDAGMLSGFERRVLMIRADDITSANYADVPGALQQRGREELAKVRAFTAFDGELNQNADFLYGVDYNLGDLVEMRNADGYVNFMRVTEQIFVADAEGERSYPTLTVQDFVELGAWVASEYYNTVWADWGETDYWADQP